jgi:hypothetical protein
MLNLRRLRYAILSRYLVKMEVVEVGDVVKR